MKQQMNLINSNNWRFNSWRLRSQIILIQVLYILLIVIMIIITLVIQKSYIVTYIASDFESILAEKIVNRQSSNQLSSFISQINYGFLERQLVLESMNKLFQLSKNININFKANLDQCNNLFTNNSELMNSIKTSYCICYGLAGTYKNQEEYHDQLILSNLLSISSTIFYDTPFYYASISDNQFYTFKPCQTVPSNWIPKERPWYQQHSLLNSDIQYTSAYIDFGGGVCISQTLNLLDNNLIVKGILANDITMESIYNYTNSNILPVEFCIINFQGQILLSSHYQKNQEIVDYFYNITITGYNKTDFLIILNQVNNIEQVNQCPINIIDTICLKNKKDNILYYIKSSLIINQQYIVIAFYNPYLYQSNFENFVIETNNYANYLIILLLLIMIIIIIVSFISFLISTLILQRPIERIMHSVNSFNKSFDQSLGLLGFLFKPHKKNVIGELNIAFLNLQNTQIKGKQNIDCEKYKIEKQLYPENQKFIRFLNDHRLFTIMMDLKMNLPQFFKNQKSCKESQILHEMAMKIFKEINK